MTAEDFDRSMSVAAMVDMTRELQALREAVERNGQIVAHSILIAGRLSNGAGIANDEGARMLADSTAKVLNRISETH